jgi:hypothetical protein
MTITVMKFDHLQQIVYKICKDIPCPHCRKMFRKIDIDVRRITQTHVDFFANCSHCRTQGIITAQIAHLAFPKKTSFQRKQKSIKISPNKVKGITSAIQAFRRGDIRELF